MICAQNTDLPAGVLGCNVTVQIVIHNGTACMYVYHFNKTEWKISNILNRILLTYICRNGLICITYADKYIETTYSNHSILSPIV